MDLKWLRSIVATATGRSEDEDFLGRRCSFFASMNLVGEEMPKLSLAEKVVCMKLVMYGMTLFNIIDPESIHLSVLQRFTRMSSYSVDKKHVAILAL